jgi:hypothetical protein
MSSSTYRKAAVSDAQMQADKVLPAAEGRLDGIGDGIEDGDLEGERGLDAGEEGARLGLAHDPPR